jgi:hypothetical protein
MLKRLLCALAVAGPASFQAQSRAADLLKGEGSAFLRENADSPVDWMPWGPAATARAKAENKPVFLFIGSFTSELAGAMRRQSFANPKVAEWLNSRFVCVIVDREEHPDVAAAFQAFVSQIRQANGWPLNVFLTPEFLPFEGATYLSPSEDWGAPGFLKLADQAQGAWAANPAACRKRARDSIAQLAPAAGAAHTWDKAKAQARLAAAAQAWMAIYDPQLGGFGDAPRWPEPELIRFLLTIPGPDRDAALATLRAIASSALHDPLDGGFFRYSSDPAWRIPYPQKTLGDQARVALAYLDAARIPGNEGLADCARAALDFALGRMSHQDGTFAAAIDATGDDYGGYLSWTTAEIDKALGPASGAFEKAHGAQASGNIPADDDPSGTFTGRNLLRSSGPGEAPSADARTLLSIRDQRPAPRRDERGTTAAHGLLLEALVRAGSQLGERKYLEAARRLGAAVRGRFLACDGSLLRFAGGATPAGADDCAALALGLGRLAAAGDTGARELSERLAARLDSAFFDPSSGQYFAGPARDTGLFMRPLAGGDPPSAESLALQGHVRHEGEVAAALSDSLEESGAQAPGDALLALALHAGPGTGER